MENVRFHTSLSSTAFLTADCATHCTPDGKQHLRLSKVSHRCHDLTGIDEVSPKQLRIQWFGELKKTLLNWMQFAIFAEI